MFLGSTHRRFIRIMAFNPQNSTLSNAFSMLQQLPTITTTMDRFLRRGESNITSSASSQASDELDDPFGNLVDAPVSPAVSSVPSQAPFTPVGGFPDYSFWDSTVFERFPNHIIHHNPSLERVWWWSHGFRLKDCSQPVKQVVVWVCERCIRAGIVNRNHYKFVANTGKSIKLHLWKEHRITVCTAIQSLATC